MVAGTSVFLLETALYYSFNTTYFSAADHPQMFQ
jgi:hypothetical protein